MLEYLNKKQKQDRQTCLLHFIIELQVQVNAVRQKRNNSKNAGKERFLFTMIYFYV